MTSAAVVENKISAVKKYLNILKRYGKYSKKEITNNLDIRGAVERYLYLAAQSTIDLAEAIIALRKFRKPSTMSESFAILEEEDVISKKLLGRMVQLTGFRNVMAHDYEKVDYDIVYDVLHHGVEDIKKFLSAVSKTLR
ncbi:MAG: DUF86 domain-containing protein [Actinomycetota bacterium]|nr:DUF86 domain-containing protein [Actinomycetota bacterium]